jgi:integrase
VRRAGQRVDGKLHLVPTKTPGSRRSIPIRGDRADRALQDRERSAAGGAGDERGLLISTSIGTPVEPRNVNRRFYRVRERAGLPWLRLHDLRHVCATFLLAEGVDPRTVMQVLGHATMRQTMERSGHAQPSGCGAPRTSSTGCSGERWLCD